MKKIISILLGAGMCLSAQAADVFRNPAANPLFNASSWTNAAGGNVGAAGPAATDVAVWDNTYGPAAAVAPFTTSSKSWQGIRLGSSLSRDINISTNGTTVVSLTLGTAGIDMSQSAAI